MRTLLYFLAAVLVAVALAGCSGDLSDPLSPEDAAVLLSTDCNPNAKGGPNACSPPEDPDDGDEGGDGDGEDPGQEGQNLATSWELLTTWDGVLATAITGDDRAGGPYVDGECGVSSIVNVEGGSDDGLLRTDWRRIHPRDSDACAGRDPRVFFVDLSAPVDGAPDRGTVEGAFGNANRVGRVAPGEATTEFGAAFNLSGCNLRVGARRDTKSDGNAELWPGTDPVEISAEAGADRATVWTVTSTGNHRAMCVTDFGDGSTEPQGDLYVVPFRIVITDLERDPAF